MNLPRIYLSARQFPHFAGLSEAQVRDRVRAALLARPRLIAVMRLRTFLVAFAMMGIVTAVYDPQQSNLGYALLLAGAGGTLLLILWHLIWQNVVVYRITEGDPPTR